MADLRRALELLLEPNYQLLSELGGGGMSRVFLATDVELGRQVVVKVLAPGVAAEVKSDRFRREIHVLAKLQHPLIVPILSAGTDEELLYYIMPFIDGQSLGARLRESERMPHVEVLGVLRDVADALAFAHAQRIVHRDVKPENVILRSGHALVLDFGIAKALEEANEGKLTRTGLTLGTPRYMAPEQAAAEPTADARADIYSLGVVGYECFAGAPPFQATSDRALMIAHMVQTPTPLHERSIDVPPGVAAVIMRCLEKNPDDRWQSAAELRDVFDDLRSLLPRAPGRRTPVPSRPTEAVASDSVPAPGKSLQARMAAPVLASLAVLALIAAVWIGFTKRPGSAPDKSLAVLPFRSDSRDNEYFSEGMTEELVSALGRVDGLRVASFTSSLAFKDKPQDIRAIAKALGVAYVLEGGIRRSGDSVRVTAQLTSAVDGFKLWSESYNGDASAVFEVQSRISASVANALAGRLEVKPLTATSDATNKAYDLYLRGRYLGRRVSQDSLDQAIALYQGALALDPNFAPAYAAIADAYYNLADDYLAPRDAYPRVRAAALQALRIDSTSAEAYASLASYELSFAWNWPAAKRAIEKALALNPNYSTSRMVHAWYFVTVGNLEDGVAEALEAARLDPLSDAIGGNVVSILRAAGRHDLAKAQSRRLLDADVGARQTAFAWLAFDHLLSNQVDSAQLALDSALAASPGCCKRTRVMFYARTGRLDSARILIREIEALRSSQYYRAEFLAEARASLGDREKVFEWLAKSQSDRSSGFPVFQRSELIAKFSDDPRYANLVAGLQIPGTESHSTTSR